jgi:signal transduction histidine kinase
MNKLSSKLIFAFALLIAVLAVQIVLNRMVSKKANADFEYLKTSIGPTIRTLDKFQAANKELELLLDKQINGSTDQEITNRVLQIIEVEIPYYNSDLNTKLLALEPSDFKSYSLEKINQLTLSIISEIDRLNIILKSNPLRNDNEVTQKLKLDSEEKVKKLFFELNNNINVVDREYSNEFLLSQNQLSEALTNTSQIIGVSGIIGLVISLIISFQTLRTIVKPIKALERSTQEISKGNYDLRVPVKGNNELTQLAKSFNSMADDLKENFEAIDLKSKELERFIYIASHDLQEPLRTISSFTELLKVQYQNELDAEANKFLNFMSQSTGRMSDLISGLLDYSRIGKSPEIELVNCNELLAEVISDMTASIIKYDAHVEVEDLPMINGYKTELRLLFQNLISNGVKFRKPKVAPNVSISASKVDSYYQFIVKDNGIGIPKQSREAVFAIFQRLHGKDKFEGTGIGLAHCKKIIDLHGGNIWLESKQDIGTSFMFTLPA